MGLTEKESEFAEYIMENSDGSEVVVDDFIIKNDFGRNAYYTGSGGKVVIPPQITGDMEIYWNGVENITSLTFPNTFESLSVYEVGKDKLPFKDNLQELVLPEGLIKIWGEACFGECRALKKVHIPDSLEYIGHNAFKNSPWLESALELEDGCYYLGKVLYKSDKDITKAVVREGTTMIGEWAFKDCKKLKSVMIPDSVKSIGNQAFCGCENLEDISDLAFVELIGESAFTNCRNLRRLMVKNLNVTVADNIFASPTRADFYVPEEVHIPNVKIDSMKLIQKLFFQLCFLQGMKNYSEDDKNYYTPFIKKSKKKLLEYIIKENLVSAFENICLLIMKKKDMDSIILMANQKERTELTAVALNLKQQMK